MNGWQWPAEGRGFWISYAALLLLAAGMGLRCERTIAAVQATKQQPLAAMTTAEQKQQDSLGLIARLDSLLAAARMGERDPFRDPPTSSSPARAVPPRPASQKVPSIPSLRALLYDNVNPMVQISLDDSISGWLHEGDMFQGWTIAQITANSVRVSKGIQNYVLSSR